jgi:sulfatase maturation enzyme AslB (radical SAM superfamily)
MIVVWRVTTHCNLSCGFCAYARDLSLPRVDVDENVVTRFAGLLADYQQHRAEPVMVSWLGGEPLLWKPIERLSVWMARELGLRVSATTNGTALRSDAMLRLIADDFAEITLSVDGPQSFHDAIRGWEGGFERLRVAVARLRELSSGRQHRLLIRMNTVLMADNVRLFAQLCDELASWGVDEITFNQLGGNDRPEFHRQHRLSAADVDELMQILPHLRDKLRPQGVKLSGGAEYLRRFRASATGQFLPVEECQPGNEFLFIDERGRIAPCSFTTTDYGVPVGDVITIEDLQGLVGQYTRTRHERRSRWCEDCPSTRVFAKFVA